MSQKVIVREQKVRSIFIVNDGEELGLNPEPTFELLKDEEVFANSLVARFADGDREEVCIGEAATIEEARELVGEYTLKLGVDDEASWGVLPERERGNSLLRELVKLNELAEADNLTEEGYSRRDAVYAKAKALLQI